MSNFTTHIEIFRCLLDYLIKLKFIHRKNQLYFFFPTYSTGGATKVHRDILKSLGKKQNLTFFCRWSDNDQFKNNFDTHSICFDLTKIKTKKNRFYNIIRKVLIKNINNSNQAKILGSNTEYFYDLIPEIKNESCQIIDVIHGYAPYSTDGVVFWSLRYIEKITKRIVVSKHIKTNLIDLYKKNNKDSTLSDRIQVIRNKISFQEKEIIKKTDGQLIVLYAGRFCNVDKNTNAFLEISNNFIGNKQLRFIAAGFNEDRIKKETYTNCEIVGALSENDLYNLYCKSHILISPSTYESVGLSILEAMYYKNTIIASNVGGVSDNIENNKNGILLDFENNKQFIDAVSNTLNQLLNDREKINLLAENATEYIRKTYLNDNFELKYKSLLDCK